MNLRRFLPSAASCALLALAGCAVGPDYRRPVVATPAFKEAGNWKPAEPGDTRPRGKWWQAFGDPVLNELEDRVEVSSNTLAQTEAQYRQARAAATIANAALFPDITADGGANRSRTANRPPFPGSIGNSFNAGLAASWEFDLWGGVRRGAQAGRATAEAAAATLESARLSLHALLAQTYFSLRVAEENQRLYDRQVVAYDRFLKITQNQYAQGVVARADVSAAETQLKTTQAQAIDLNLQRVQFEHALAVLLGEPPATFKLAAAALPAEMPMPPAVLPSELLERRPDVAVAERQLAAASAGIGVAKAGYFPLISLSGSAGYQGQSSAGLFTAPNEVWALGAAAVMPLFDAGRVRAQVAQARAGFDASLANYRQTVLTAFQDVEDNLAAATILAREAVVQDEAVAASRQAAAIALNQYQAGTVSYLNVVSAESTQLQAERSAVDLLGRRLNAAVALFKAVGGDPFTAAGNSHR